MEVYFARHTDDWHGGGWLNYLHERGAIAIRFDPIESWSPEDYSSPGGASAIRHMNTLNDLKTAANVDREEGAYVFASYTLGIGNRVVIGGRPKPDSKCFLSALDDIPRDGCPIPPLKVLFLDNPQLIQRDAFPHAYLLAPPRSTFVRWEAIEPVAIPWICNRQADLLNRCSYLPASIEVACEEYMRLTGRLTAKIFRNGGTMAHFDIVGVGRQGPILAQVKNGGTCNLVIAAANAMIAATGEPDANLYIFCPQALIPRFDGRVQFISVEDVLQTLKNSYGEEYLRSLQSARFTSSSAGAG
ncbi:hypothetical protein METUNv1_01556 [Methyloversatilis universalis FAM5]|uniref:Uncharacterized protein n=1 Tax=Methyloversatilis universalis (strain ATCC BAA-1314 / DSM 25237 / JCM 13912 / CCUG 52030 / FAM5) TaxID=1000565 RepID=F5RBB4_METUF|nr:hypothetical protein [Methyloversatilis universalis]EGK72085.1 hypothetical protein METUNv1_01556 [Methyloversatilis universalis FAM5]